MQDFRNLAVWRSARELVKQVYVTSRALPANEEFELSRQVRRAAVSVCANIAEGCGRRGDREFRRFLDHAMGSACELECELILCTDLNLIADREARNVLEHLVEVKRMLAGLMSRLKVSKPARQASAQSARRAEAESR